MQRFLYFISLQHKSEAGHLLFIGCMPKIILNTKYGNLRQTSIIENLISVGVILSTKHLTIVQIYRKLLTIVLESYSYKKVDFLVIHYNVGTSLINPNFYDIETLYQLIQRGLCNLQKGASGFNLCHSISTYSLSFAVGGKGHMGKLGFWNALQA